MPEIISGMFSITSALNISSVINTIATSSAPSIPAGTPAVSVPTTSYSSPLDGAAQFAVLALLLALVAYFRNTPERLLRKAREDYDERYRTLKQEAKSTKDTSRKLEEIYLQIILLDIFQISLVSLSVAVSARLVVWKSALIDNIILWSLFVLALLFLLFHLWINGKDIKRSVEAYKRMKIENRGKS